MTIFLWLSVNQCSMGWPEPMRRVSDDLDKVNDRRGLTASPLPIYNVALELI